MQCPECSAETPETDRFCRSCGSKMRASATAVAVTVEEPPPAAAGDPPSGRAAEERAAAAPDRPPAPALSAPAPTPTRLLPAAPFRLLWSPRKPWRLETSLSTAELGDLFERELSGPPKLLRRLNAYHRNVRWDVKRNAMSGQVIATCVTSQPIPIGFGANKVLVDVSGDTIVLDTSAAAGNRTTATVGVGCYTRWWWFYAFPATHLTRDVVKAITQADRTARVTYPWSIVRILSLAAVLLLVIISAAGGGGGNASGAADVATDTASPAAATSAEPASGDGAPKETTEADPIATDTTEADTTDPAEAADPASALPAESRGQMQADITNLLRTWHQDIVDGDTRGAWNLLTARKQRQSARKYGYREWADNQRTLAPYLDPSGLRVRIRDVDDRTGVVTVSVRGMRWSKPGARCSSWSGLTWVRYEDGEWLYDPGYSTTPQRERAWKDRFGELLGGSC